MANTRKPRRDFRLPVRPVSNKSTFFRLLQAQAAAQLRPRCQVLVNALFIAQHRRGLAPVIRGMATIAREAGQSERTCWRAKNDLVAAGWVRYTKGGGRRIANTYELGETAVDVVEGGQPAADSPAPAPEPAEHRPGFLERLQAAAAKSPDPPPRILAELARK